MFLKQFNSKKNIGFFRNPILRLVTAALCLFAMFGVQAKERHEIFKDFSQHVNDAKAKSEYDKQLSSKSRRNSLSKVSTPDIWKRIRKGFGLSGYEHQRVDAELRWYVTHKKYMDRVVDRATPFLYHIMQEIDKRGMPSEIALLPVVESAFQPFAYSPGKAEGIWQFIPATGRRYGLKIDWWYDGRRDAIASTEAALKFLQDLHRHFDGDWLLALAAYNTGQGNVDRAIRRNLKRGKGTDFWSLRLPKETKDYVPKLLAVATLIDDPAAYRLKLEPIPDRPYFTKVNLKAQIDLARAAEMAQMGIGELYALNAAYSRWATPPNGPNYLILPIGPARKFQRKLARIDQASLLPWIKHTVSEGESLGQIARKHQTSIGLIASVNKLRGRGRGVRDGDHLLIPVGTKKSLSAGKIAAADKNKKIEHVVQRGDTFWHIAKKYSVSVSDLAQWNAMSPKDMLHAGKRLVVWAKELGKSIIPTSLVSQVNHSTTRRVSYRVRKGESLGLISQKFNVSIPDIQEWNNLAEGDFVYPGQELLLIVDLTKHATKM